MRIWLSELVVLGILFAVFVAFSCGDNDGPDVDTEPFGGPYPFKKLEDFRFYKAEKLSISKVKELEEDLWLGSIEANRVAGFGDKLQKYNYAIDADDNIFVAVWDLGGDHKRLGGIMSNPGICETSNIDVSAESNGDWSSLKKIVDQKMMIDWYPDKTETKPCGLTVGGGLLDALSKHFMLAQGADKQIGDYDQAKWLKAEVAYAGEIFVYVEECTFTLNGDSGTYGPKRKNEVYGQRLAAHFEKVLGVAPTKVNDVVQDLDTLNTEIALDVCPK